MNKKISGLGEESKGGAIPFFFNLLPFSGRYPGEPGLDLPQQCQISFFYSPVKLTDIEGTGFLIVILYTVFIKEIHCRRLINNKDVDLVFLCSPDNRLIPIEEHQVSHPVTTQDFSRSISFLDGYRKAFEGVGIGYSTDLFAKEYWYFDLGIGLRKIKPSRTFHGGEDCINNVKISVLHGLQGFSPVHCLDINPNARLLLPEPPLIDQNSLDFSLSIQKGKGGIIVIHYHTEGTGRQALSPGGGQCLKKAGQQKDEDETVDNKLIPSVFSTH